MGATISWSKEALIQLEDIHFYIKFKSKSFRLADKVIQTIFDSTEILKSQPKIIKLIIRNSITMEVLGLITSINIKYPIGLSMIL